MTDFFQLAWLGVFLASIQVVAAIPWLSALDSKLYRESLRRPGTWLIMLGVAVLLGLGLAVGMNQVQDSARLGFWGKIYGAVLHLQLTLDLFALFFPLLLAIWPHGGAVALAAFREGIRQPMFLLICMIALIAMIIAPFLPYFTFGEDAKMVRELGYDLVMLSAVLFAVLAASISISEEIEGRTAITVMSKPVSRREFLIGKFLGLLFAALLMTGLLGWVFNGVVWFKLYFDGETIGDPSWVAGAKERYAWLGDVSLSLWLGIGVWLDNAIAVSKGLIFGFCQVMVLLALAVGLATRLPWIVNLITCFMVFFLGHLSHVLVHVSQGKNALINFMAKVFNTVLPGLEYFNFAPVIAQEYEPNPAAFNYYLGTVLAYAMLYSLIALLLGLVLFEDRDLA